MRPLVASTLALLLQGCPAGTKPPAYTQAETECIALDKARTALEVAACGQDIAGPCSTDAIYDRAAKRRMACLGEGPK
jgi:hypothetical protein